MAKELQAEKLNSLKKEGSYEEAAELLLSAGQYTEASELFAKVWKWDKAISAAKAGERFDVAYLHTITARDRAAGDALIPILKEHPEQAMAAARTARSKKRLLDAGILLSAAGETSEAAQVFEEAGELMRAAEHYEQSGEYRKAGLLFERCVRQDPKDEFASLRLGSILAHFGRYDAAIKALQQSEKHASSDDTRQRALALMIGSFDALNMRDAAGQCLNRLNGIRVGPTSVQEFVKEEFGEGGLTAKGTENNADLLAGRYRLKKVLGSGASGRVHLAYDGFYGRDVALKVLTVGHSGTGRDAYARFAKEARIAAGIEHANVVPVFEYNPDGPFIVMEYMAGGTLEARLTAGQRLPLATIEHVSRSILKGLAVVHRRGIIHRDLKPENVFFGSTGDVKIGDFGVAHLQDFGATLTGAMMGTLAYMAPEQITGGGKPQASTDLYAMGVIVYRMLTGALPFPGPDFVTQHLSGKKKAVSEHNNDPFEGRFDEILSALLSREVDTRPSTVEDLLEVWDGLDWTDPDEDAVAVASFDRRSEAPPPQSQPPASTERYVGHQPTDNGAIATDTELGRLVRLIDHTEERAEHYRRFAKYDHPFLQAVYDIDEANQRIILEEPKSEDASLKHAHIAEALSHLHQAGLVHGSIKTSIVTAHGRSVLLLPTVQNSEATKAKDLRDLNSL